MSTGRVRDHHREHFEEVPPRRRDEATERSGLIARARPAMKKGMKRLMQKLGGSPSPAQALLIRDSDVRAHRTGDVGVHPNALTRPSVMREGGEELLPVIMQRETIVQNLGRTLRLLSLRRQKESAVTLDPVPRCKGQRLTRQSLASF